MKTLEKVGVISLAKIEAVIGLILGFILGILNFVAEKFITPSKDLSIQPLGASVLIIGPLTGLVYGFLGGLVSGFLYNLLSKWIGGIKLEFKEK